MDKKTEHNQMGLVTPPMLEQVTDGSSWKPYFGSKMAFILSRGTVSALGKIQQEIHASLGGLLANPIDPENFFLVLHELVSGPDMSAFRPLQEDILAYAVCRMIRWKKEWKGRRFHLEAAGLHIWNQTALVLELSPTDEESRNLLQEMYGAFERCPEVRLGSPMVLRVILAYFRPGQYSPQELETLYDILVKEYKISVVLSMEDLAYMEFDSANHYPFIYLGRAE